jgi:hypothetical protein
MFHALLALLLVTQPTRSFSEERDLLDRRLETLRRMLPDGPSPASDIALVREMAASAHLGGCEVLARPPVETGSRGTTTLDVTALGRLQDIDRFFRAVALSNRLIDVEAVSLSATPENVVHLTAALGLPYRPAKVPLPPPPEGTRARVAGIAKAQADTFLRDAAISLAKSEAIVTLRRSRRNPRLFLSELAAAARDRPVVVTGATLGDEFLIRGITVGEGPARALESRFERGFFRISEFLVARHGACRQFEVRGHTPVAGLDAELPLPSEDPFSQGENACRIDRDSGKSVVSKPPPKKVPGKGNLSLRARDVDLADVFMILHLLSGEAFVVDPDVQGRATLELYRVSLDEALAALLKAADLRAVQIGSVRRILLAKGPAPRPSPSPSPSPVHAPGPGMSFSVKRAEVRDILAVMTEADPQEAALGPPGSLGRLSIWAKSTPLADIRAALLDASGLVERTEDERLVLERHPGSGESLAPVAGAAPDPKLVFRPADLSLSEFEIAALAADGDKWTAFSYTPAGTLNPYRVGDHLADGVVRSVESTDVLLDTEDGPLRLTLPPPPQ